MKSLIAAASVALTLALAVAAAAAGTAGATAQPLAVESSSLKQDAQSLVWTLKLAQPFAPGDLARDGRTLCLLLERASNGTVGAQLCVTGRPGHSGTPRLQYMTIGAHGHGPVQVIAAAVARHSTRDLTASFTLASVHLPYAPLRWQVISTVSSPACAPAGPRTVLFPAAPTLLKPRRLQLVGCTAAGPAFVAHGPTRAKVLALTFDDGPWYDTPQFLRVLEREQVPATFFEIGDQIATYGQRGAIERRMLTDGDMIGDHTWSHPDVAGAGAFARDQLARTAAAIRAATHGFTPCLFRAPYGAVSPALISEARSMGFTTIQWDIDPRDWALPGTQAIVDNVLANARPGAIVIQHDGGGDRSQTLAALPREIDALRRRGYRFETVTQLLGYRLIYK